MEIWMPCRRHSKYEVSDLGRVRSIDRIVYYKDGRKRFYKGQILTPGVSKQLGYAIVVPSDDNNVQKTQYVHLLVAEAFLPPKPDGHEINHKDGNKANPAASNLEWKTHSQNAVHSISTGLRKKFGGFCAPGWHKKRKGGTIVGDL